VDLTRILREYAKTPGLSLPQFVVIPTGTRNVVADNLGIMSHSAVDFAKRLAAKIEHNLPFDTAHLNPLKINDEYGFMYGSALPANAVAQYYDRADYRCAALGGASSLEALVRSVTNPQCRFTCRWNKVAKFGGKCPKCGQPLQRVLGDERAFKVLLETLGDEIKAKLLFRQSRRIMTKPVYAEIALPRVTIRPTLRSWSIQHHVFNRGEHGPGFPRHAGRPQAAGAFHAPLHQPVVLGFRGEPADALGRHVAPDQVGLRRRRAVIDHQVQDADRQDHRWRSQHRPSDDHRPARGRTAPYFHHWLSFSLSVPSGEAFSSAQGRCRSIAASICRI